MLSIKMVKGSAFTPERGVNLKYLTYSEMGPYIAEERPTDTPQYTARSCSQ
jgi:hypothetical protein